MNEKENDLEKLIRLAHVVAKPYVVAIWFLSILLSLSVLGNIYTAAKDGLINIDADADRQSNITQNVER